MTCTARLAPALLILAGLCPPAAPEARAEAPSAAVLVPAIDGPWWQVAGDPDLGRLTDPKQQPVDFGVWQAADGTWQLWSCIRHTRCGGKTRLFHGWEGASLTDKDWKPLGIVMQADPKLGETPGGLQAPHVIRRGEQYLMFYGDWHHICSARSRDGKTFTRILDEKGRPQLFGEDDRAENRDANARDPMVLLIGDVYHCYYTAHPNGQGAVFCRTSKDLRTWSDSKIVGAGGSSGTKFYSAECPHVVRHEPSGYCYLFRTQRYGPNARTNIYRSKDPMDFGVGHDRKLVARLPVAAPEVLRHEGQWYIASLMPSLKGIHIARMKWEAAD